jgi:U3 small nucleolar RNA-associated protein 13
LAIPPNTADPGSIIASADAEGVITVWTDTTTTTMAAVASKEQALIEDEQRLSNYVSVADYRSAITLALSLNHPGRLLSLFASVVTTATPEPGSISGLAAVDDVLAGLSDSQLAMLLCRIRDWNTNAKTAIVAQRVLGVVVKKVPATRLVKLRGIGNELWAVLESYTERHYKRTEELIEESWIVEYTLREMEQVLGGEVSGMGIEVL